MKRLILLLILFTCTCSMFAQAPQRLSYQAVIRNSSNVLVANTSIGMRISILQGSASGTEVYKEIYNPNPQTNANGLVSLQIGSGIALTGTFSGINWASGSFYIKTETDPTGGTNYTITGVSQLLSVPYALYAASAGSTNPQTLSINDRTISLSNGGGTVTVPKDSSIIIINSSNYQTTTPDFTKTVNIQGTISITSDYRGLQNGPLLVQGGSITGTGSGTTVYLGDTRIVNGVYFNNVAIDGSGTKFINCKFNNVWKMPSSCTVSGGQITGSNMINLPEIYSIDNCAISSLNITTIGSITSSQIYSSDMGSPSGGVGHSSNNTFYSSTIWLCGSSYGNIFMGNKCYDSRIMGYYKSVQEKGAINISSNNFIASAMKTNVILIQVDGTISTSTIISNNIFMGSSGVPNNEFIKFQGDYTGSASITKISNNTSIGGNQFISITNSGEIYHTVNDNRCINPSNLGVSQGSFIIVRNNN